MSGSGADSWTATPIPTRASGRAVPGRMRCWACSSAATSWVTITMSAGWPAPRDCISRPMGCQSRSTVWPGKLCASGSTKERAAPPEITFISSPRADAAASARTRAATPWKNRGPIFFEARCYLVPGLGALSCRRPGEKRGVPGRLHRLAVEEALPLVAQVLAKEADLSVGLHALGHHLQMQVVPERDDRLREHAFVCAGADRK